MRAAELDISVSCIAEGVFTLFLFPVTVAVVQQSAREVGSCSLDVKVRYCRMQGRRRRREVRLKVGRGQRRPSRGTTGRGRGAYADRSRRRRRAERRRRRAERRRRRSSGRGEPTVGGRAIVRTRWGIAIQDRGLASCAPCGPGGIVEGADSVCCEGRLREDRGRATRAGCHVRRRHRSTLSSKVVWRQM